MSNLPTPTLPVAETKEEKPSILKIYTAPSEELERQTEEVTVIDDEIRKLVTDMAYTMQNVKWGVPVGLAAPQVGRSLRLFIARGMVFINPRITWATKQVKYYKEGCYSLEPNKFDYPHWRPSSIRLRWQDLDGEWHERRFNDPMSQVIQHEYDHLNIT